MKFSDKAINFYLITKFTAARSLYSFTRMLQPMLLLLAKNIGLSALSVERDKTALSDTGGVTGLQKVCTITYFVPEATFRKKKLCIPL